MDSQGETEIRQVGVELPLNGGQELGYVQGASGVAGLRYMVCPYPIPALLQTRGHLIK